MIYICVYTHNILFMMYHLSYFLFVETYVLKTKYTLKYKTCMCFHNH